LLQRYRPIEDFLIVEYLLGFHNFSKCLKQPWIRELIHLLVENTQGVYELAAKVRTLELLFKYNLDLLNELDDLGRTLLLVDYVSFELLEWMINHGSNID